MIDKVASRFFFVCLLQHVLSVPMSEFFQLTTGSSTLGSADNSGCENSAGFPVRGMSRNIICVSS